MLVADKIDSWARLEHNQNLRWRFDGRKELDGLFGSIVENMEPVLGESGDEVTAPICNYGL